MLRIASSALTSSVLPAATSRRASVVAPAQRQVSQVLLAAAALSILGSSRVMSAAAASPAGECANPQGPVPQNIQNMASDILKMYASKSPEEQSAIISKHYREDARFVDPLMDVGTPREIKLAMLSLIKIFKDIDMEKRSLSWNEKPELPAHIKAADVQQVVLNNRQVYHMSKTTIDLDVNTYLTIDPKTGLVVRHEDKWLNKGFKVPTFMKRGTGVMSSLTFKLFGWGKEVDHASAATPQTGKM